MYILPITFEKHKLQHLVGHPHLVVPTPVDTPNPCHGLVFVLKWRETELVQITDPC